MRLQRFISVIFLAATLCGGTLTTSHASTVAAAHARGARHATRAADATHKPKPTPPPLTVPADLNPATNLLPVGTMAPNFRLATATGLRHTLSDLRGHPVVLEFIAVWCPHCQHEAPIVNRLVQQYRPLGVYLLDILANPYGKNYDLSGGTDVRPATRDDLAWYARTFHVSLPILIDPRFRTVNRYGIDSYPTLYILDARGIISKTFVGETPYAALSAAIQSVMPN
jgi:thiol-disulfide isomerase/thioredoxin